MNQKFEGINLTLDDVLFGLVSLIGLLLTIHGMWFLDILLFKSSLNQDFILAPWYSYIIIIVSIIAYILLKQSFLTISPTIGLGILIGLTASIAMHLSIINSNVQMFILLLTIFGSMTLVSCIHRYFLMSLNHDVLEMLFKANVTIIRYLIVLYVAWAAVFRFTSLQDSISPNYFLLMIIYATLVMIVAFMLIGYWILLPCWNGIVDISVNNEHT